MTEALTTARTSRGIAVADDRRTDLVPAKITPAKTGSSGSPPGTGDRTGRGGDGRRRRLGPGRPVPFGRLLGPALLIAAWWAASAAGVLDPRILSGPGSVVSTAVDLVADGRLQGNVLISLQRAGLGLFFGVAAGVALAVVAGLSRTGEYLVDGPLQIKRAIRPWRCCRC